GFRAAFDAQVQILQQALSTVTDATVARTVSARISAMQFGAASAQDWNLRGEWTLPGRRDSRCGYCCWDSEHHGGGEPGGEHHSRRDAHEYGSRYYGGGEYGGYYGGRGSYGGGYYGGDGRD
ncbi:hypothetical protein HDU83_006062, partial [Entophlyctis luteolus]